jgi:hypothetical protein
VDEAEEQRRQAVASAPKPSISPFSSDDEFDDDVGPGINGHSWRDISQHLMTNLARVRAKDQSIVESVHRGLFLQGFHAPTPRQARWIRDIFVRQFAGKIT